LRRGWDLDKQHAGLSSSVDLELSGTMGLKFFPTWVLSYMGLKGTPLVAFGLRRPAEWRAFLDAMANTSDIIRVKLLTCNQHDSVLFLSLDTPHVHKISRMTRRIATKRIVGLPTQNTRVS
jgi:hypothetical protein